MTTPRSRCRCLFAAFFLLGVSLACAAELPYDRSALARLSKLDNGAALSLAGFPGGPTHRATIRFERVEVFAKDAHVFVETATGRKELPHSDRLFFRGYSADGSTRVALALTRDGKFAQGNGSGPEGRFALRAAQGRSGSGLLDAQPLAASNGAKYDFTCANEGTQFDMQAAISAAVAGTAARNPAAPSAIEAHALRFATVAVDTDLLFMSRLFANNTTNATNWIAGMFNTMNLMYERDLLVQLQVGTTILRTGGVDPYASLTPGASTTQLDLFGSYWKTNGAAVSRSFAVLLSGVIDSTEFGCSSSGIAWINSYCNKGTTQQTHTVGSYSVNQVCTSIAIDPDGSFDALLVGHELGHNFGAFHTHCTNASSGAVSGTNTIDQCLSGESVSIGGNVTACYSGATSCPASGPGAPAGTIMSYCNQLGNGCGPDNQNVLQFHPAHVEKVLLPDILAAPAGCLNSTDDVFYSSFE